MDNFTKISTTSFTGNIAGSFMAIFFGLILLGGSIVLLWWNEGRSVEQMDALAEMSTNIVTLSDTAYHPEHNNKLVVIQGKVKPLTKIKDSLFGVTSNALVLKRTVEMYQWQEKSSTEKNKKLGGSTETTTTYHYDKKWSSNAINSSPFKHSADHSNPAMSHHSKVITANMQIGDYRLSKALATDIPMTGNYENITLDADKAGKVKNHNSFLYIGENPATPEIGDIKISYQYAAEGDYTLIAQAKNKTLSSYTTENDKTLAFVRRGKVSAEKIFQSELSDNSMLSWVLRFAGLLMMFIGFAAILGLIATVASFIPGLGYLVNGVAGIVATILTFVFGSIIIASAWFAARPMLALIILAVGVIVAVLLSLFGKKRKAKIVNHSNIVQPPPRKTQMPPERKVM